ncbi:Regulator of nonsense-mediated decay- UPF3 [Apiospora phragmitis]|uniref:Regulator of nonsense-mediated decay- UPF3 n=1 Tax=Apiospora phragmitis TaxID=2905665 RepID=A0ABR1WW89_9PEZI
MASVATSRKANGTGATDNAGKSDVPKRTKAPATSKKVKIRRLPPGMTADECWSILGDEWKVDSGKVDWVRFDAGKVANGPFKESKPATVYLRLIDATQEFAALQQLVRTPGIWQDAKETFNDPCLRAPPELVVAEFGKVAMGKARIDPRQGTIDTDPTYMAFLQQLTEPITSIRDAETGADDDAAKDKPKVTSTPLVTFIKEKEAKAKEAAAAKSAKQHARQESSGVGKNKDGDDSKKKGKGKESSKSSEKTEKASDKGKEKDKQPVKIMTKKAAQQEAAEAANAVADQMATSKTADEGGAPKSRRAGIAAAAKLLQRDLGLSPGSAHRRARQDAAKAEPTTKPEPAKSPEKEEEKPKDKGKEREKDRKGKNAEKEESAVPTGPKVQSTEGSRRSRGKGKAAAATEPNKGKPAAETSKPTTVPIILLKKENTKKEEPTPTSSASPATPAQSSTASSATPAPPTGPKAASGGKGAVSSKANQSQKKGAAQPAAGATRAFVKHANPSQGVTEQLLKQSMETFGSVTFVEIDKRKGFAYVDFGDAAALAKAIAASPVTIAQGTVQVLERKDKKPAATATPGATTPAAAAQSTTPPEKAAPEAPAATATTPTTSEKPKRGRGGRGRRGGGGGKDGANAADGKGSSAPPPPAT